MDDMKQGRTNSSGAARMPALFVGHGSPMNVVEDNRWSRGFTELGQQIPRPAAILAISAHWYVDGTLLTAQDAPRTIHDFSGFPAALYEIQYPAPGRPALAARVRALLGRDVAGLDTGWGLDHGTWSVLHWMFPAADIPVLQLSIDRRLRPAQHLELARHLGELRDDGVLLLGSGNIVHNLSDAFRRMRTGDHATPAWAQRFDERTTRALIDHDSNALVNLVPDGPDGALAHPTPDHWLPLLYVHGASDRDDAVTFPHEGFDLGSLSMRNVRFG